MFEVHGPAPAVRNTQCQTDPDQTGGLQDLVQLDMTELGCEATSDVVGDVTVAKPNEQQRHREPKQPPGGQGGHVGRLGQAHVKLALKNGVDYLRTL